MAYTLSTSPNKRTHGNERLLSGDIFAYTQLHQELRFKEKECDSWMNTKGKSNNFRWANKHCSIPDQMVDSLPEMELLMKPSLTFHTENTKCAANVSRPFTAPSRRQRQVVSKGKSEIENRIARRINNARESLLKSAEHAGNDSESNKNDNSNQSSDNNNRPKKILSAFSAHGKGISAVNELDQQSTNLSINGKQRKKQAIFRHSTSTSKYQEKCKAQVHSLYIDKRTHAWNKEVETKQRIMRHFASSSSSSSSSSSESSSKTFALSEVAEKQSNMRLLKQHRHNKQSKLTESNESKLSCHKSKSKMSEMINGKFAISEPLRISECYGIVRAKREKERIDEVSKVVTEPSTKNEECKDNMEDVNKSLTRETNLAYFLQQERSNENNNAVNVHTGKKAPNNVHEQVIKSPVERKVRHSKFMRELESEPSYSYRVSLYASCNANQCARLDSPDKDHAQTISYCNTKWNKAGECTTDKHDKLVHRAVDEQIAANAQSVNNGCANNNPNCNDRHNGWHDNKFKSKISTMKEMVERQRHNFEHARFAKHANLSDYLAERDRCRYNVECYMLNSDNESDELDSDKCGDANKNNVSADDTAMLSKTQQNDHSRYVFEPLLRLCNTAYPRRVQPTHRPESMWTAKAHQLALYEWKKRTSKQIREYKLPFVAASLSMEAMQVLQKDIIAQIMKSEGMYSLRKNQYSKNDLMRYLIKRNNLQSGLAHLYQPQPSDVIDLMPSPAEAALVSFIF